MKGFDKLSWGFIFLLGFRIQGFDILPDPVGYYLFYSGLEALTAQSRFFAGARKYSLPLMMLSLFSVYQVQQKNSGIGLSFESWPFMIIGLAVAVLNLIMVQQLCAGIIEMARAGGLTALRLTAEARWKLYLVTNLVFLFLTPLVQMVPSMAMTFILFLFIMMVVVIILMAMLMKQAGQDLQRSL